MFEHIMVALDGSDDSRSAGQLALRLARKWTCRLTGVAVIDVRVVEGPAVETLAPLWGEVTGRPFQPEVMRLYRERAESTLGDFCDEAEVARMVVERSVEIGVAEEALLEKAMTADLLVMGRRGEHAGYGRQPMGATLWRVLHRSPCPVLVAAAAAEAGAGRSPGGTDLPSRPVVAWERGPSAAAALDLAIDYCRTLGAEVRVVHAGGEEHDAQLAEAQAVLAEAGVPWESARIAGPPADVVAEALERWDGDCLFMGAFGRGRLRDFLFGSNTVEILGRIRVPVFLTP